MKNLFALSALVLTFVTLTFTGVAKAQVDELEGLVSAEEIAQDMDATDPSGLEAEEFASHPVYPYPHPHYNRVTCYAKNLRGHLFAARGRNAMVVQEEAMTSCRIVSSVCKPAGCVRN